MTITLQAKVLGEVVEFHSDGSSYASIGMFDKIEEIWGTEVEIINGVVTAGMNDELSLMALFHVIDPDFEIEIGSEDVRFLKRLVQGEDVLMGRTN